MRCGISGAFDLFHEGHKHILREAAKGATELIVLLNTDRSIRRRKGKKRPVWSYEQRLQAITSHLKLPHKVYPIDSQAELQATLERLKPDRLYIGSDYKGKKVTGRKWVGQVVWVERLPGWSTTKLIGPD